MKTKLVSISSIKPHPNNPRIIKDGKFELLKKSIADFPEMMETRPLVVTKDGFILGGNMRYRAAVDLGLQTVPVIEVDWSEERQREFIIKDNASFGDWDFDILANEWSDEPLTDWGINTYGSDEFFKGGGDNGGGDNSGSVPSPKITDNDYSQFELVMLHTNKIRLMETLLSIKNGNQYEKLEEALMHLVNEHKQ